VSAAEIDEYLRAVDEPKRETLQALRRTILEIVPDAEQGISYRVPAFRIRGKGRGGLRRVPGPPQLLAVQRLGP